VVCGQIDFNFFFNYILLNKFTYTVTQKHGKKNVCNFLCTPQMPKKVYNYLIVHSKSESLN
jgi:hypothetical protein